MTPTPSTTEQRLTADEFARVPSSNERQELVDREVVSMPPPRYLHTLVGAQTYDVLATYARASGAGRAFVELGCRLREDRVPAADVAFIRAERLPTLTEGYFTGAPDLVVEVISPTDSWSSLEAKAREWLEAGAHHVWLIDPAEQLVHVHRAGDRNIEALRAEMTLDASDLIPGCTVRVEALFNPQE